MYMLLNMKALHLMVQKLWQMLKFTDMSLGEGLKVYRQGHKVKTLDINGKASLQGMYLWNMCVLP